MLSFAIRPRARQTLFPYTTLFRSHALVDIVVGGAIDALVVRKHPRDSRVTTEIRNVVETPIAILRPVAGGDRKSTRLNSSHPSTSYAVFCLQKENNVCRYNFSSQL